MLTRIGTCPLRFQPSRWSKGASPASTQASTECELADHSVASTPFDANMSFDALLKLCDSDMRTVNSTSSYLADCAAHRCNTKSWHIGTCEIATRLNKISPGSIPGRPLTQVDTVQCSELPAHNSKKKANIPCCFGSKMLDMSLRAYTWRQADWFHFSWRFSSVREPLKWFFKKSRVDFRVRAGIATFMWTSWQ